MVEHGVLGCGRCPEPSSRSNVPPRCCACSAARGVRSPSRRSPPRWTCRARPPTASCARCARSGSSTRTATPRATPSPRPCAGCGSEWDRHDLRSRAMNWADSLAGSAGQEVLLGMPAGAVVELVHHVFRPDGSPQRLRTGEQLPLHATAVGKCLLAFAPIAVPRPHELDLQRYTGRTVVAVGTPDRAPRRGPAPGLGGGAGGAPDGRRRDRRARCGPAAGWWSARWASRARRRSCSTAAGHRTRGWSSSCSTRRGRSRRGWGRPDDGARRRGDRPGHHLDPLPAVQPGRPDGRRGPARAPPVLPAVGLGRARRGGDLAQRHPDRPGRAAQRGPGAGEHRRAGHREPARDDRDLGPAHRDAAGPGHHLAGHPVGGGGRRAGRGRARGPRDAAVRAPAGDLLRRAAAALAARPRRRARGPARRPATCCSGRWRAGWCGG